jgi:putative chitinase
MEELASGEAYDDRADLGNTDPDAIAIAAKHGTTPGRWWKGHGPIQITGYFNHMAAGFHLGLDLRNEPELLCDPVHGCRAAALFWRDHACNDLADRGDFIAITRRINGGINGLSDRVAFHARARACLLSPPP